MQHIILVAICAGIGSLIGLIFSAPGVGALIGLGVIGGVYLAFALFAYFFVEIINSFFNSLTGNSQRK